jgi:hypothetical protein
VGGLRAAPRTSRRAERASPQADAAGKRAAALPPPSCGIGFVDRRAAAPSTASGHVVQRDIGFEYETNADTYLAGKVLTNVERQAPGFHAAAPLAVPPVPPPARLIKGDVLVGNMDGLHAKADDGGPGLGSDLELETDPFPETPAGRVGLHRALKKLERFCALIDARSGVTPHLRSSHLAAAFGGVAPNPLRYIRASVNMNGNPQATAGVRLDRVEELMERTVGGPTAGPHAPGLGVPMARLELGAQSLPEFQRVGDAPGQVRAGIVNYVAGYAGGGVLPVGFPSDALVGLCSLLLTYIRGAGGVLPYAKQIAPLMARTDFGTIFTTDVPPNEQAFLSHSGGVRFRNLFRQILTHVGVVGGLTAPLFALEPQETAALGLNISGQLTRNAWLSGITQGNDRLTRFTFPSAPERPYLQGLGGLQHIQGPDPTGGGVLRPVLELRRIQQNILPHDFTEIAMGIYDYIVALNAAGPGAHPAPYARVARAQKQPKLGQWLRYGLAGG